MKDCRNEPHFREIIENIESESEYTVAVIEDNGRIYTAISYNNNQIAVAETASKSDAISFLAGVYIGWVLSKSEEYYTNPPPKRDAKGTREFLEKLNSIWEKLEEEGE